jgi:transposase
MTLYIGLDGHSKTSTFVCVNGHGKVVATQQVITCERELLEFIRGQRGTKKLIFEESHLSQWFYALLLKEVDELTVCHPGYLGKKPGAKTDLRDATHLAQELRCGHVIPVFHDQSQMMELRSLVSGYKDLVQEIVRTKNRYKSLFRSEAIKTPGVGVYRSAERIQELSRKVDRFVAEQLFAQIQFLDEKKKIYIDQFKSNMTKHPDLKRLDAIPGIDCVRAHVIASIICSAHRFKNKHKLWAYSMLVRHNQLSDGVSYGKVKVAGRVELREAFIGIAESIMQCTNNPLRSYYVSLKESGIEHHNAKIALARKVASICLAVLKNRRPYEEEQVKRTIAKVSKAGLI